MMPVEEYRPNRGINSGRNLEDEAEQEIERSADESCPGDRENPGPDDIEGHDHTWRRPCVRRHPERWLADRRLITRRSTLGERGDPRNRTRISGTRPS